MSARAKGNNKSRFDSYSVKNKCIDHIPYYLSGLSRAQFLRQPFSKQLYTLFRADLQEIQYIHCLGHRGQKPYPVQRTSLYGHIREYPPKPEAYSPDRGYMLLPKLNALVFLPCKTPAATKAIKKVAIRLLCLDDCHIISPVVSQKLSKVST